MITVVYNAQDLIERTIESIHKQTYSNIEHIIIDGASTDGTLAYIEKYAQLYGLKYLSEPDKGIYEAMNKGLSMANGEYVWFMNAGDIIASNSLLSEILAEHPGADIYYGKTIEVDKHGNFVRNRRMPYPEKLNAGSFSMGMLVSHQALIVKRTITGKYNAKYKISADIDWVIAALKKAKNICNTNRVLCHYLVGGKSRKQFIRGNIERFSILSYHYGFFSTLFNHVLFVGRFIRAYLLKIPY